jgi:hypothetical protein
VHPTRLPREARDAIHAAITEWIAAAHRRAPQLVIVRDGARGITLAVAGDGEPRGEAFRSWRAQARQPELPIVRLSRRRLRGSGLDQRHHPCHPHARGRPADPAIASIGRAVSALVEAGYTRADARRAACDEILFSLGAHAPRVLDVPPHVLEGATTDKARQARLRRWLLTRWRAAGI